MLRRQRKEPTAAFKEDKDSAKKALKFITKGSQRCPPPKPPKKARKNIEKGRRVRREVFVVNEIDNEIKLLKMIVVFLIYSFVLKKDGAQTPVI